MSSCVPPGGQRVLAQQQAVKCGCTCLIMWPQTTASGQVSLSATSMSATVLSCPFFLTRHLWLTTPCPYRRSCCLIGCCATGGPLPTLVTPLPGCIRPLSAESSVSPFGRATPTPVAGLAWTWRCGHMHKWEPGTMYVTSGTSSAFTSEECHCHNLLLKVTVFNNRIMRILEKHDLVGNSATILIRRFLLSLFSNV